MTDVPLFEALQRGETAPQGPQHPRAGFLRERAEVGTVGFDLSDGSLSPLRERLIFGEWEQPEEMAADTDLDVLRSLHERAIGEWRGMAQALQAIADDDDPALNDASRLKTAARVIKPKLDALADVAARELERVDQAVGAEEAAVAAALKPADPAVAALHSDIRAFWKAEAEKPRGKSMLAAILTGEIDDDTLVAIASAPAYMSSMSPDMHGKARALLAERVAPDRVRRINALRVGKARTLQALSALDRTANRLIDFKKAAALTAKERSYG